MTTWFAVYCTTEFKVEASLQELGFAAYCPAWTVWSKSRSRERVRAPLFPGYLFVGLERDVHGDWPIPIVNGVEGVIGVLKSCGAPVAIQYERAEPETWRARSGHAAEEPFSILGTMEQERAGSFDLTRDSSRSPSSKRKARRILRSFYELGFAFGELKAA